MRALQKLVTNSNSTAVSIPRVMLITLGWLPGQSIILETVNDDSILLRRPVERDVAPLGAPKLWRDGAEVPSK